MKFKDIFTLILIFPFLAVACSTVFSLTNTNGNTTIQSEDIPTVESGELDSNMQQPLDSEPPQGPPRSEDGQVPKEEPPDSTPMGIEEGVPGGNGSFSVEKGLATATGSVVIDGETERIADEIIKADEEDQSAVYAINGADVSLENVTIITTGDSTSNDKSSFYGLNAGVLAASGSVVHMSGGSIGTSGRDANGAFASGENSLVNLSDMTINATGGGAHGVMATLGGEMILTNVNINTSGRSSAPIATDRGSGTIKVFGGTVNTAGEGSPCYYSTGVIDVQDAICLSSGSQSVVIEGSNAVNVVDSQLTSTKEEKNGIMIYQSFSGDAQGSEGVFNMTGGSLSHTATTGPLFFITNATAYITLQNVDMNIVSGELLLASATDRWGKEGENGGTVYLTSDGQSLTGDIRADAISRVHVTLKNKSTLIGMINDDQQADSVRIMLDELSTWYLTGDSYISCVADEEGIAGDTIKNIIGNGYNVYYDGSSCSDLGNKTYTLINEGELLPME